MFSTNADPTQKIIASKWAFLQPAIQTREACVSLFSFANEELIQLPSMSTRRAALAIVANNIYINRQSFVVIDTI